MTRDSPDRRRCGEALIELLEAYGTEVVFGIPGVHTLEYFRGLGRSRIRTILARHEQGAAFMADGYARASGRPGVCCVITGPGLTNAATAVAQSYSDSVPTLVLTSVNDIPSLGRGWGRLHELVDQLSVAKGITENASCAYRPADVPAILASIFDSFASERPRPAIVQVPIDVLEQEVEEIWEAAEVTARLGPDPAATRRAAELLMQAERPALIVGGGAVAATGQLRELQRRLAIPAVSTAAGKGVIREDDPLSLGATLNRAELQRWLASRDVVAAIGTELSETDSWTERLDLGERLIRMDIDESRFGDQYPPAVALHCDAQLGCAALLAAVRGAAHQAGARTDADHPTISLTAAEQEHQLVLDALRGALPQTARVYADMTQIAYTGVFAFPVQLPGRYLYPAGYGTLGYALPAAVGGLVADRDTPTVALAGDAGLLYSVQEMATAVELRLPLIVCLWNNHGLGEIRDDMLERGVPPIAVEPRNPDYAALAAAFGLEVRRPAAVAEIGAELAAAVSARVPTLLELDRRVLFGR
jgi:5-guanidino-2-oxopentanoate decarboxylase